MLERRIIGYLAVQEIKDDPAQQAATWPVTVFQNVVAYMQQGQEEPTWLYAGIEMEAPNGSPVYLIGDKLFLINKKDNNTVELSYSRGMLNALTQAAEITAHD